MEQKIMNCPHCGKIIPKNILNGDLKRETVNCPMCGSQRSYKDGIRYTNSREIQRYLCRECGYRFSERPPNAPKFYPL